MIDQAGIGKNDLVLETGTGTGSFTEGLAEAAGKVITVESDSALAKIAGKQLSAFKNVRVINADILECNPKDFECVDWLHASPPCPSFSVAKNGGVCSNRDCDPYGWENEERFQLQRKR